jgi:hypothetical protein
MPRLFTRSSAANKELAMSDPTNNTPNFNPQPINVWPPPPEHTSQQSQNQEDIQRIGMQNCWLLLLLIIITLGIYVPFWMIRTAKSINRIAPDYAISIPTLQALFGLIAVNSGGALIIDIVLWSTGIGNSTLNTIFNVSGFAIGIFQLIMIFQVKGALNQILWRTFPRSKRFSGLGAFFFGPLSLQIEINQFIREMAKPGFTPNGFYP